MRISDWSSDVCSSDLVDFDGDGRSELRQVFTAGGKVLGNDPADRQAFHVISPQPLPHKHFGRATAEKVMDVQAIAKIGRASCRERVCQSRVEPGGRRIIKKKKTRQK